MAAAQVRAARGGGRWSHPLSRRAAAAPAACSSPCCGRLGSRPGRLRRRCHLLSPRAAAQPWSASLSPLPLSTSPTPHTHCRPRAAKPEIRLTPGKGLQDLTCTVEDLIDQVRRGLCLRLGVAAWAWRAQQQRPRGACCRRGHLPVPCPAQRTNTLPRRPPQPQVVKGCKVVAFVKGTRTQPQCGFSYKVLTLLQEVRRLSSVPCLGCAGCFGCVGAPTGACPAPDGSGGVLPLLLLPPLAVPGRCCAVGDAPLPGPSCAPAPCSERRGF